MTTQLIYQIGELREFIFSTNNKLSVYIKKPFNKHSFVPYKVWYKLFIKFEEHVNLIIGNVKHIHSYHIENLKSGGLECREYSTDKVIDYYKEIIIITREFYLWLEVYFKSVRFNHTDYEIEYTDKGIVYVFDKEFENADVNKTSLPIPKVYLKFFLALNPLYSSAHNGLYRATNNPILIDQKLENIFIKYEYYEHFIALLKLMNVIDNKGKSLIKEKNKALMNASIAALVNKRTYFIHDNYENEQIRDLVYKYLQVDFIKRPKINSTLYKETLNEANAFLIKKIPVPTPFPFK